MIDIDDPFDYQESEEDQPFSKNNFFKPKPQPPKKIKKPINQVQNSGFSDSEEEAATPSPKNKPKKSNLKKNQIRVSDISDREDESENNTPVLRKNLNVDKNSPAKGKILRRITSQQSNNLESEEDGGDEEQEEGEEEEYNEESEYEYVIDGGIDNPNLQFYLDVQFPEYMVSFNLLPSLKYIKSNLNRFIF